MHLPVAQPAARACARAFRGGTTTAHPPAARHAAARRGRVAVKAQADRDSSPSRPAASTSTRSVTDMTIDELDTNYCDDFECTSSPAIEQTIRSLARDLTRLKYTIRLFQPDVQYSDGFRSFKGSEKYSRPFWPRDSVTDPRVRVTGMRMVDPGTAEVKWQLSGKVGVFPVDIPMTTTVTLNLVTGRVLTHNEAWDLSALSPPAAAAAVASRVAWSARQASQDAGEGLNKAAESLSSLTSMDEDQYYQNPTDPTRFFQQNNSERNDAINIALLVAGLYLVFKVYSELEGLH